MGDRADLPRERDLAEPDAAQRQRLVGQRRDQRRGHREVGGGVEIGRAHVCTPRRSSVLEYLTPAMSLSPSSGPYPSSKPSLAASRRRKLAWATGRISPESETSPNQMPRNGSGLSASAETSAAATARSAAGSRSEEHTSALHDALPCLSISHRPCP